MQGIEFEDDRNLSGLSTKGSLVYATKPSFMVKLLAKVGIEDAAVANYVLLGFAVVLFGITIFMYADLLSTKGSEVIVSHLPL